MAPVKDDALPAQPFHNVSVRHGVPVPVHYVLQGNAKNVAQKGAAHQVTVDEGALADAGRPGAPRQAQVPAQ